MPENTDQTPELGPPRLVRLLSGFGRFAFCRPIKKVMAIIPSARLNMRFTTKKHHCCPNLRDLNSNGVFICKNGSKNAGLWRVRPDSGIRKGAERDLTTGPCLSKDRENVFSAHGLSPDVRRGRFGYGIFLPIRLLSIRIVFEATGAGYGLWLFQIKNV
ncbi:MAG: hypothetical protein DBX40_07230 [Clostridiales bacterium]|nr:MAG: hypothetical protein DBX40_07230 [Clostridiales bacterium]